MRSVNTHNPSEPSKADVVNAIQTLEAQPAVATASNKPVAAAKPQSFMTFVFTQIANPADTSRADAAAFVNSLAR